MPEIGIERRIMHALLVGTGVFAFWTVVHQFASFAGISWTSLTRACAWLALPVVAILYWYGGIVAGIYARQLPDRLPETPNRPSQLPVWLVVVVILAFCAFVGGFAARYVVAVACIAVAIAHAWNKAPAQEAIDSRSTLPDRPSDRTAIILIAALVSLTVLLVLSANRSDFDDAEYIQLALQTLQHPERAPNTFDSSLGVIVENFRFAPYRVTAYETFVALLTQWSGLNVLNVYYLLLPAISAVLSVLMAFVFARWFVPLQWSILAVAIFLLIALSWGETHQAYGNRMFVRLFQGKGLLPALTTPMTILAALLYMRRPGGPTWAALLLTQIVSVGASSSGLVTSLLATAVGLLAGFMAQPGRRRMLTGLIGALTCAYSLGLGSWLKFLSTASGKIEEIGTYLAINVSFGSSYREALTLTILSAAVAVNAWIIRRSFRSGSDGKSAVAASAFIWLVFFCLFLTFNPVLSEFLTALTSRNMNWRLAWAAPVPLLLAVGIVYLIFWAKQHRHHAWNGIAWLLPVGLIVGFAAAGPWTLAKGNGISWSFLGLKAPPEYQQAVEVAERIRQHLGSEQVTALVEPYVGTWLTVVAPDFRMIMPGHDYPQTLKTILDKRDFEQRIKIRNNIDAIASGDKSIDDLLDAYGVNAIVTRRPSTVPGDFEYLIRYRKVH